ncbi:MAG: hypothetical protein U0572_05725 [Phycisphaerales bacterium]
MHDAGKALEVSGIELGAEEQNLERLVCPVDKVGKYTHRHVLWTAWLLRQVRNHWGGVNVSDLFRIACYHHRPSENVDEKILQRADWMASGHDRRPREADESAEVTGLRTVLAGIQLDAQRAPQVGDGVWLPVLSADGDSQHAAPSQRVSRTEYRAALHSLAPRLVEAFSFNAPDPSVAVERTLAAARAVFCGIPSSRSWSEVPDVSLFDHSMAVAAFASCLAMHEQDGVGLESGVEPAFRIASIRIGKIQSFLFRALPPVDGTGAGEKGRAKRLRARSFFVSLVSHLIARRILDATGLPLTNLLIDVGGRATVLLPVTPSTDRRLAAVAAEIRQWFNNELGGALRLDLDVGAPIRAAAFERGQCASTIRESLDRLDRARTRLLIGSLRDRDGWSATGWVLPTDGLPVDSGDFASRLQRFGGALPRAQFVAIDAHHPGDASLADLRIAGYHVSLHADAPSARVVLALHEPSMPSVARFVTASYIPRVRDGRELQELRKGLEAEDDSSLEVGDPLTFNVIAERSRSGPPMLGVLKADVDRLGRIVGYGLGANVSFGRLATLSRTLDGYFKHSLMRVLEREYPHTYTVFAGGDDLFLIGPWDAQVALAQRIHEDFVRLSGGNPHLTISAGLAFSKAGTPIRSLAEAGHEMLDRSKDAGRNRVSLFGATLLWDQFQQALQLRDLLRRAVTTPGELSPSLLYRLVQYGRMGERSSGVASSTRSSESVLLTDVKWRAQLSYDLKRNFDIRFGDSSLRESIHRELAGVNATNISVLRVAATLALYSVREDIRL